MLKDRNTSKVERILAKLKGKWRILPIFNYIVSSFHVCSRDTKIYKVSIFRSLFGAFSDFCLLLFTFRLNQCFRILLLAFQKPEKLFFFRLFCYLYLTFHWFRWSWNRSVHNKASQAMRCHPKKTTLSFPKNQLTWKTKLRHEKGNYQSSWELRRKFFAQCNFKFHSVEPTVSLLVSCWVIAEDANGTRRASLVI